MYLITELVKLLKTEFNRQNQGACVNIDVYEPKQATENMAIEMLIAEITELLDPVWINPPKIYLVPVRPTLRNRFKCQRHMESFLICNDQEGDEIILTIDSEVSAFISRYRRTGHLWWANVQYSRQREIFALNKDHITRDMLPVLQHIYYSLRQKRT